MIKRTNIRRIDGQKLVFTGFSSFLVGSGDVLKQIAIIFHLWIQKESFPISFEPLYMGSNV